MDEKMLGRQFKEMIEMAANKNGCKKCNGYGEFAVQDGGKFKSVPCGCDERHNDIKYRR